MSVIFETRPFIDGSYPAMDDPHDHPVPTDDVGRLDDPDITSLAAAAASYTTSGASILSDAEARLDLPPSLPPKDESPAPSTPSRTKAIPKPEREVRKNAQGVYECSWPECTEDTKEFSRKCEWRYVQPRNYHQLPRVC